MIEAFRFFLDVVVSLYFSMVRRSVRTDEIVRHRYPRGYDFSMRRFSMDSLVVNELIVFSEYDRFLPPLKANDWIVDVGAHIGVFGVHMAKTHPGVRIVCLEPNPDTYALLEKNIHANGLTGQVYPVNKGVAGASGKRDLYLDPTNTGGNSLTPNDYTTTSIRVPVTTIADVLRAHKIERIALLKMDCEGAEYEILQNTPDHILKNTNMIIMEYHTGGSIDELRSRLERVGFKTELTHGMKHPLLQKITYIPLLVAKRSKN